MRKVGMQATLIRMILVKDFASQGCEKVGFDVIQL